ncbi:GDP-fucose protein O-fucosyltransferase [Macleaya cordata]|uniref:O-fucosyltransferase family protein n=1 Tax=Macleaya cordata TaxID=56857 RepID=A0A200PTJ0_MACCD|nr:GDP-fucose protein O-fucosyltransferase [Macleaya cordata]
MHGFSRLGNGRSSNGGGGVACATATSTSTSSPVSTAVAGTATMKMSSPPTSPSVSPRFKHGRSRKSVYNLNRGSSPKLDNFVERIVYILLSAVFRRRGVLLFAPIFYISGMLMYMDSMSFNVALPGSKIVVDQSPPKGSIYRSPQVFENLWPFMQMDSNHSYNELMTAWHPKSHQTWKPCVNKRYSELPRSNGFLIIEANGGLNQQRISICDAVAVAALLNATLVIPMFHLNSVWRDSSKFGDIFDEEFFIYALRHNVKVIKEIPEDVLQLFDNNISNIVNLRVKAWSTPSYYLHKVLPKLLQMGAVRIAPFSNRLAHAVPSNIQSLRCLANYEALRFSEPIRSLAERMVDRMVRNSSMSGGKYVSVHLRFEEDMVAFSCCTYDGGEEEKHEMDIARERSWRGKFRKRGRVIKPGAIRMDGKCPLTPLEVGMMLRGMGFDNTTTVYVASGKIYRAEKYMAPLRQLFPLLETKETLASQEELAPFKGHSSRLAALDYTVCLHSEVFVTTQGGNFPHFLMGHRRYFYGGHAKTIRPDKRKLALLFDSPNIRWENFKRQMHEMLRHSDMKGYEMRKPSSSLYTFPMPDCMCKQVEEAGHVDGNTTVTI